MSKGKMIVLVAFILAMVGTMAYQMVARDTPAALGAQENNTVQGAIGTEYRGIALQLHGPYQGKDYEKLIDEIAATKANTLSLVVSAYQENCASTSIFMDLRRTPSLEQLKDIVRYAHAKGIKHVTLMPIVLLENARHDEWRGLINPGNWDDWWEDYTNVIMQYAWLSNEVNVDVFMVGSELISTEKQTDRWKELIKKVRGACPKTRLSYSSNWDHYTVPEFWGDLDIVGMTTYYDLTDDGKSTSEAQLTKAWTGIRKKVLEWQAKVKKPIMFTEVGWPNQETCAQYPWDYYRAQDKPDPELQARCFKTFFDVWGGEKAVCGFIVWEWRTNVNQATNPTTVHQGGKEVAADTGYVPKDKPAMDVIQRAFAALAATSRPVIATKPADKPATQPALGPVAADGK